MCQSLYYFRPGTSLESGYSSCEEGPRSKKPKRHEANEVQSSPHVASTSQAQDASTTEVDDADIKPDKDFQFDEQLFDNMFASSGTLDQKHEPGSLRPV